MPEITRLVQALGQGNAQARDELLPLVYDELRQLAAARLAHEKPGQTLQATALVHEVYLRLMGDDRPPQWSGKAHFFNAAAEAMRRILIDQARRKGRKKRGGEWLRQDDLEIASPFAEGMNLDILALDEALADLAREEPAKVELVKLRFFCGMSVPDAADALGISTATAERHWRYARAWLADRLRDDSGENLGDPP